MLYVWFSDARDRDEIIMGKDTKYTWDRENLWHSANNLKGEVECDLMISDLEWLRRFKLPPFYPRNAMLVQYLPSSCICPSVCHKSEIY